MGRLLSDEEIDLTLWDYEHSAFRLELQPAYAVGEEEPYFRRFLAGDLTRPSDPEWDIWDQRIAAEVANGKRIERVRLVEEPPTEYQRWLRWGSQWTLEAGELHRYITRSRAEEVGLLAAVGAEDWWLFDSSRLMVMRFDDSGQRIESELITEPEHVVKACAWRDLAVHYSVPEKIRCHTA